jgi:hypothetical protein
MSIPTGTKFHGVASFIDTVNKGSSQANSGRDAYTIEQIAAAINILIQDNETMRLVPEFITASAGGTLNLSTTKNLVDISWTGGSGVFELILPSATEIPYRLIRFVNDATVSASNNVHITALAGETIDGTAFYNINKSYNGCMVWSDGSEWIVIQAKST